MMERQYKDSGIEWIGKIPEGWNTCRFKALFATGKGLNFTKADLVPDGISVVSYGQIHSKLNSGTSLAEQLIRFIPESLTEAGEASKVHRGDFIFADTSEDKDGCGNAVYVDKELELYAGYHTVVAFSKDRKYSPYLAYLFLTDIWRSQIRSRVTGIKVYSISQSILNQTSVLLPPLPEQQRIASYLDKKCGEIDALIALQEKMIAQLTEYKQAVITEAVTKGLDPNAKLVPSGIEWIGDVPEGWRAMKTLYCLSMPITDGPHETPELYDDGVPFISADAVSDGFINFDNKRGYISEEYYEECCKKYIPQRYDVYMIKSGASTGRTAIVETDEKFTIWSPLAVFRSNRNVILPNYLLYSLRSDYYQKQVQNNWSYGTQQNIGMRTLEKLSILVPPLNEQHSIASYLDIKCSEIDSLIALKRQKIESLNAYKKSVIYEAVTGKTII